VCDTRGHGGLRDELILTVQIGGMDLRHAAAVAHDREMHRRPFVHNEIVGPT
jgi:hypothetical protein